MDRDLKRLEGEGVTKKAGPKRPRGDVPFVRRFLLMGPLDDPDDEMLEKSFFDEPRAVPRALSFSGSQQWRAVRSLRDEVELGGPDGPRDATITCAFVWIHTQSDIDAVLWFGHDDGARVWFDAKLVHDRHFHGRHNPDRFGIPVRLEAGPHRLLFKVQNYSGAHMLSLRIAHPDGTAAPEIATSLSPDELELGDAAVANPAGLSLDDVLLLLPRDRRDHLTFDSEEQLGSIAFDGSYGPYPLWSADPSKRRSHVPNPGAAGVIAIHPDSASRPSRAYWRLKLPDKPSRLRLRVSATTLSALNRADVLLRVGVFDGALSWIVNETVGPDAAPAAANWRWVEADLSNQAGRDVLVVLEAANGGKRSWDWEGLWIDELELR